ncbi:MAG: cytochrome b [Gammaproteobacteria bacterium]|nr:MAG: cytochrome b [Gammaproteobacteria bacterium]
MKIKNTTTHYGLLSIGVHWLTVIFIAILFPSGLIMVDLDYYDSGYQTYPHIHKSLGVLLFSLTIGRMLWLLLLSKPPEPLPQSPLLHLLAKSVHALLYLCLLLIPVSGYLISTADGRSIDVFNWFSLPALFTPFKNQADIAGNIHATAAWGLMTLIALHVVGTLKHHFINKDNILKRMFGL